MLSLSSSAEILRGVTPPHSELPIATYTGLVGLAWRLAQSPLLMRRRARQIAKHRLDVAICAMPGPLDLLQLAVLRRVGVPAVVVVHDADAHPGDSVPVMLLQRRLTRRADMVVALSEHVAARLREQRLVDADKLIVEAHPPFMFGPMPPPFAHGGAMRLLCFGRLLPYKGLDLLASAIRLLGTRRDFELRVVGSGPESSDLASLRALSCVTVENRWVPEDEVGGLIAWADALVLPYKEASQSGIAPTAIAAGRFVVSTRVGGLVEQLQNEHLAGLHEPDAASLAAALRNLLDSPPGKRPGAEPGDPAAAWRDMAERLLERIAASSSIASQHRHGSVVRLDSHLLDGTLPKSTDIASRSPGETGP